MKEKFDTKKLKKNTEQKFKKKQNKSQKIKEMENMRTSIMARIFRLTMISFCVIVTSLGIVGIGSLYSLSSNKIYDSGYNLVEISENIINDELEFLASSLDDAVASPNGDNTFTSIFMYGDDCGYDFSSFKSSIESMENYTTIFHLL